MEGTGESIRSCQDILRNCIEVNKTPQPLLPSEKFYHRYDDSIYQEEEDDEDVNENALDNLIGRVLLSATMNEGEEDKYGIASPDDGFIKAPDYIKRPKKNYIKMDEEVTDAKDRYIMKNERKSRKGMRKSDGKSQDRKSIVENGFNDVSLQSMTKYTTISDADKIISIPATIYRKNIEAELESRAREMQEYYDYQLQKIDGEYLDAVRQNVYWQDRFGRAENELQMAEVEIGRIHKQLQELEHELIMQKEAKRRKRLAKKQRGRVEKSAISASDTVTGTARHGDDCEIFQQLGVASDQEENL